MKTLVMTTIFVVTVVINAFGGNIQENFAYNEVMNGNQVESQIVYKVENGKFLQNHLKYNFTYGCPRAYDTEGGVEMERD